MIWGIVVIAVVLMIVWLMSGERTPEIGPEETTRAAIELHAIRRRLDVAQTRSELQRDAMQMRRELAEELRQVDR